MVNVAETETRVPETVTQDAPGTESPPDAGQDAESILAEIEGRETQAEGETEAGNGDTESEKPAPTGLDGLLEKEEIEALTKSAAEEAAEKARQEERETRESEEAQRNRASQLEGVNRAYQQRAPNIRAVLQNVLGDATYTVGDRDYSGAEIVNWVLNEFTSQHGQYANVINSDWWRASFGHAGKALPEDAQKALAQNWQQGKYNGNFGAFLDDYAEAKVGQAKSGLHTDAQLKKAVVDGKLEVIARIQKEPAYLERILQRAQGTPSRNGGTPAASNANPTSVLEDSTASREEQAKAFERKYGFKPPSN